MVSLSRADFFRPVQLLQQHHAGQLMRKCHRAHAQLLVCPGQYVFPQAQASADNEDKPAYTACLHLPDMFRQILRRPLFSADRQRNHPVSRADLRQNRVPFLRLQLFFQRLGRSGSGLRQVRDLRFFIPAVPAEALQVLQAQLRVRKLQAEQERLQQRAVLKQRAQQEPQVQRALPVQAAQALRVQQERLREPALQVLPELPELRELPLLHKRVLQQQVIVQVLLS